MKPCLLIFFSLKALSFSKLFYFISDDAIDGESLEILEKRKSVDTASFEPFLYFKLITNYCFTRKNLSPNFLVFFDIAFSWISKISACEIVAYRELTLAIARQARTEIIHLPGGRPCTTARDECV